jgi:Outer membrane protein beta-barrel domain
MRILGWLWIGILLSCTAAVAQDTPRFQLFGGYSYTHLSGAGGSGSLHGWNAALSGNLTRHLSLVADFAGGYDRSSGTAVNVHTFLFGPQVTKRAKRADLFAQALFGVGRAGISASGIGASDTAFATALGGGVDVHAGSRVSFRVAQIDYLLTRFGGNNQNNLRVSTGLVIRWGKSR